MTFSDNNIINMICSSVDVCSESEAYTVLIERQYINKIDER